MSMNKIENLVTIEDYIFQARRGIWNVMRGKMTKNAAMTLASEALYIAAAERAIEADSFDIFSADLDNPATIEEAKDTIAEKLFLHWKNEDTREGHTLIESMAATGII